MRGRFVPDPGDEGRLSRLPFIPISVALIGMTLIGQGCGSPPDPIAPPSPFPSVPDSVPKPPRLPEKLESVAPELGFTVENYPKVDGSTSTQPLLMLTACKILAAHSQWIHTEQSDSQMLYASNILEIMEGRSASQELCERVNRLVQTHGTGDAYNDLIERKADFLLAARLPSDDEWKLAGERGVELDVRPVALDAFVFLLNRQNPVRSLSLAQIRGIYSGQIVNWKEVGGPDAAITPYQRTRNSGSQELMQTLVMKGRPMVRAPELLTGTVMSFPFLAIDKDVHGIGYSVFYYQEFMAPQSQIKACAVDGALPGPETIRSRLYPLVTDVHVVLRSDSLPDSPAVRLRDWMLSPAGQAIVEESGYVSVGKK